MASRGAPPPPASATSPAAPRDEVANSELPAARPSSSHYQSIGAFPQTLGTSEAFAIIIGIVVGSGVFTSPGPIDANVPSPGIALIVWLIGGILAWTGAASLAELGTAIPGEGTDILIAISGGKEQDGDWRWRNCSRPNLILTCFLILQ
jgi:L-type amino acid transporter 9